MKKPQAVKWNRFRYPALSHETLDALVYDAEQMDLFLEEQQQKLEALRGELRFFESLEVNLEEFKAKDIVKHFRKVLGDE